MLIRNVCWANSNVDRPGTFAASPQAFGMLYQWETAKGWIATNFVTGGDTVISTKDPCPAGWRMPTLEETKGLVMGNGVGGTRSATPPYVKFITNLSSGVLYFPIPKLFSDNAVLTPKDGYWSATKDSNDPFKAWAFLFMSNIHSDCTKQQLVPRNYPLLIRCVVGRDTTGCGNIVTNTSVTVCAKDLPYEWGDTTFDIGTESRTYSFRYVSVLTGCDSLVNLHLTIQQPFDTTFYDTVCRGASYNLHGFSLSNVQTDDVHTLSLSSRAGCDSTLTLHLKVRPVYDTVLYDTICQGDSYYKHGLNLAAVTESLTRTWPLQTIHGCDSTVTLNLHVWPKYLYTYAKDVCDGDTVDFRGRRLYKSGVYYDSLTTVHGCDSIYRMTLTVHSTAPSYIPDVVCYGSGYHKYGFHLSAVYRDTVFRDTFQSVWGCDSIRILSLSVRPVYDTPLYDTVCQGDDYRSYGFSLSNVQKDGVYTLPLSSCWGCDSVLTLHLKVHPVYDTILYDSVCPSARYIRPGFHLSDVRESGTHYRRLHSIHGCDSIVTLNLHVWPTYFYPRRENICEGDTFDFRGRRLYESGTYYDSLTTVHGCDSVYCLYLTVHPVYDVRFSGILCEGTAYSRYDFHVTTPGEHYRYLKTVAGCDSTVLLTLTEEKKVDGSISVLLEDCSLHGYAFFFDPVVPQSAWLWDMGDGKVFRSEEGYHTYADSGLYRIQLRLETSGGCENLYSYVQYVPPYLPEIPIRANRLLIDEDYPTVHFRVDVLPGMRCEWDFGDGATGVGDSVSHTYDAHSEKYYDVLLKVFNADSCVTESRAQIEVAFFPKALNTFSPNGDGINDVFMGDYRIEIINRNGLRIYTGDNGWDGTYNGSPAPADTYFYRLYYRTALGERMKTGYVTLIR